MVLLDLYILVTVYKSFHEDREDNESETGQTTTDSDDSFIRLSPAQFMLQWGESACEAMPQVILQTSFLIRSTNTALGDNSDSQAFLLLLSLIASVISVANKYRWMDDGESSEADSAIKRDYRGFHFKAQLSGCLNWSYVLAQIWRYCHVITRFTVLSLIWGVCGEFWVAIFVAISWLAIAVALAFKQGVYGIGDFIQVILISFILLPGMYRGTFVSELGIVWFLFLAAVTCYRHDSKSPGQCLLCTLQNPMD